MAKAKKKLAKSAVAKKSPQKAGVSSDIQNFILRFKEKNANKKIVLHLGFNGNAVPAMEKNYPEDKWTILRMGEDAPNQTHIIGGLKDVGKLPTESVDAVWCSYQLQRLMVHEHIPALKIVHRIIAFGGHLFVRVADMQTIAGYIARGNLTEPIFDTQVGPIAPIDVLFGWRPALENGLLSQKNHSAFTAVTLGLSLREAGFCNIVVTRDFYDLNAAAYKIPVGHPQFLEKVSINQGEDKRLKEIPPVPPLARTPHPGAKWHGKITDELDVPPKIISNE